MSRRKNGGGRTSGAQAGGTGQQQDERDREQGRDWADEAAQARTADDPRAVAPHDRAGVPSTGDTR